MKKVAIIIIILCSCISSCKCQVKNGAWIEERFALDIMERKVVNGTYLFPIVGFEKIDGNLFVLTYGGEPQPITISNEKEDVGQIIDFAFAINTQEWPKDSIEKYSKADYFIKVEENVIELTVACSEKKEKYRYIGRFGDSRFKSILEIKGWLLNYLIPPAIQEIMKYLKFKMPSEEGKESSKTSALEKILAWLLEKFIPKANPDFDAKYDDVETWFVEYDEENDYTNREIGLDKDGHVIVLGPFQRNLGYWVDNDFTLQNYEDHFDVQYIDKAIFEDLWRIELVRLYK